jgi:hypothetical protein
MPSERTSHPDRTAATLANVAAERARRGNGPWALPGEGAADCRIDLKLLQWRAQAAARTTAAARERLDALDLANRPDLRAGTVQDGVARGLAAALEEVITLAPPAPAPQPPEDPVRTQVFAGRELKKKRDLLVASSGPRVRFSRKEGVLLVDRERELHSANFLRFEARRDQGTLDGFRAVENERPRLYSAQFLQPQSYLQAPGFTRLVLAGRLGRGPIGWPCEVELTGLESEPVLHLVIRVTNGQTGWRLRARFLGVPAEVVAHECSPVREVVANDAGGFVAFTLVRSCTTLLVDGEPVAVPAAAVAGTVEHRFRIGAPA